MSQTNFNDTIPEQFAVKAHPALFEGEGQKNEEHFSHAADPGILGKHFLQLTKQYYFPANIMLI